MHGGMEGAGNFTHKGVSFKMNLLPSWQEHQMLLVCELKNGGNTICERYELKIDYVVMDQVCTWSHY
jgi:hypothetical protein